jgi:hypothetical protein
MNVPAVGVGAEQQRPEQFLLLRLRLRRPGRVAPASHSVAAPDVAVCQLWRRRPMSRTRAGGLRIDEVTTLWSRAIKGRDTRGLGMGFSFKVAPGVRIRASSRGVRTSIGPRIARVHVGGGRTGISTGAGPVSFYTSLSGGSRRRSSGSGARSRTVAASQRAVAQAAKQQAAEQLQAALHEILNLHRQGFATSTAPQAPPPPPIDTARPPSRTSRRDGSAPRPCRRRRSQRQLARLPA